MQLKLLLFLSIVFFKIFAAENPTKQNDLLSKQGDYIAVVEYDKNPNFYLWNDIDPKISYGQIQPSWDEKPFPFTIKENQIIVPAEIKDYIRKFDIIVFDDNKILAVNKSSGGGIQILQIDFKNNTLQRIYLIGKGGTLMIFYRISNV